MGAGGGGKEGTEERKTNVPRHICVGALQPRFETRMDRAYRARWIFAPYYRLLNELRTGSVTATEDGELLEPALRGD